jgi:hypothetical protein
MADQGRGGEQRPESPELIEGGDVQQLGEYPISERHRAETARYLAYSLVGILAVSVLLQYSLTVFLIWNGKADGIASLDKLFNNLLPVLSGLVGGAVTYYFTKDRR